MSKGTCQGRHGSDLPLEVGGGRSVWFHVSSHDLWWRQWWRPTLSIVHVMGYFGGGDSA